MNFNLVRRYWELSLESEEEEHRERDVGHLLLLLMVMWVRVEALLSPFPCIFLIHVRILMTTFVRELSDTGLKNSPSCLEEPEKRREEKKNEYSLKGC